MEQAPLRVRPAVVLHLSSEHVRGRDMTLPVTLPGTKDCDAVGGAFRPQWREGSLRRLQIVATLPQSAEAALRSRCNDGSGATRSGVPLALSRSLPRGAVRPASVLNSGFVATSVRCPGCSARGCVLRCPFLRLGRLRPLARHLPRRDVQAVPRIGCGDHENQARKLLFVVMPRRLIPDFVRHGIRSVGEPRDGLGKRQRGAFGVGEAGRIPPGRHHIETLVGFARLFESVG